MSVAERSGTRVTGGRKSYSEQGNMMLLSRAKMGLWSLELVQTQPRNKLPTFMITLVPEIKKSSFSGLDFLGRHLYSVLPLEAMLVSVVLLNCPRLC